MRLHQSLQAVHAQFSSDLLSRTAALTYRGRSTQHTLPQTRRVLASCHCTQLIQHRIWRWHNSAAGLLMQVVGPQQVCGNGIVEGLEQCDDGDTVGGDGCSATCQVSDSKQ